MLFCPLLARSHKHRKSVHCLYREVQTGGGGLVAAARYAPQFGDRRVRDGRVAAQSATRRIDLHL